MVRWKSYFCVKLLTIIGFGIGLIRLMFMLELDIVKVVLMEQDMVVEVILVMAEHNMVVVQTLGVVIVVKVSSGKNLMVKYYT